MFPFLLSNTQLYISVSEFGSYDLSLAIVNFPCLMFSAILNLHQRTIVCLLISSVMSGRFPLRFVIVVLAHAVVMYVSVCVAVAFIAAVGGSDFWPSIMNWSWEGPDILVCFVHDSLFF